MIWLGDRFLEHKVVWPFTLYTPLKDLNKENKGVWVNWTKVHIPTKSQINRCHLLRRIENKNKKKQSKNKISFPVEDDTRSWWLISSLFWNIMIVFLWISFFFFSLYISSFFSLCRALLYYPYCSIYVFWVIVNDAWRLLWIKVHLSVSLEYIL